MTFRRFFLVRLAWAVVGVWLAVTLVFLIFRVVATQPRASVPSHFDRSEPVVQRYGRFVWDLVSDPSGGRSLVLDEDVNVVALKAAPASMAVVGTAVVLWLGAAVPVGLLAARTRRGTRIGRAFLYLAIGSSPLWIAILGSYLFAHKLGWLPLGYCDFFDPPKDTACGGGVDWIKGLLLPGLVLAAFFAAIYARVIRRVFVVDPESPTRGRALVIARMVGRDLGYALGAAALVEIVFGVPGLGRLVMFAVEGADLAAAEAALLVALGLAITVHFVLDVVVGALDEDLRRAWPVAVVRNPA